MCHTVCGVLSWLLLTVNLRLLLGAHVVCRCRSVVRVPQPECEWNTLQLPVTSNSISAQKWLVSPTYFFFQECTCTKVGSAWGARPPRHAELAVIMLCAAGHHVTALSAVTAAGVNMALAG
jgi:hypothetical protein